MDEQFIHCGIFRMYSIVFSHALHRGGQTRPLGEVVFFWFAAGCKELPGTVAFLLSTREKDNDQKIAFVLWC